MFGRLTVMQCRDLRTFGSLCRESQSESTVGARQGLLRQIRPGGTCTPRWCPIKAPDLSIHNTGAFVGPDGAALAVEGLPNAHMRLYGGAQYHRAMAEFRCAVGAIACPDITCRLSL